LPPFAMLAANYPTESDPDKLKKQIGGDVDADWITNTCTIRVSKAFNYAGHPQYEIPVSEGLYTVSGADNKNYGIRVEEFNHFLRDHYGPPNVVRSADNISIKPFLKKNGIINWHVSGWTDATGHFTLWNNARGLYEGKHVYFNMPNSRQDGGGTWLTKVELWEC